MRIVFLNVWHAELPDKLTAFFSENSASTDIFCLQEASEKTQTICVGALPDFSRFCTSKRFIDENIFIQATYIRDNLVTKTPKALLENNINTGVGLYTPTILGQNTLHVCNIHGGPRPGDKLDNPDRLLLSKTVLDFFDTLNGPKVIGGDFNLRPETESIKLFEKHGYRNLVKEYDLATTRNHLAWDNYPGDEQYFSDYVFVSPDVKVKGFSVPNIEISDHLPLILEIEADEFATINS